MKAILVDEVGDGVGRRCEFCVVRVGDGGVVEAGEDVGEGVSAVVEQKKGHVGGVLDPSIIIGVGDVEVGGVLLLTGRREVYGGGNYDEEEDDGRHGCMIICPIIMSYYMSYYYPRWLFYRIAPSTPDK